MGRVLLIGTQFSILYTSVYSYIIVTMMGNTDTTDTDTDADTSTAQTHVEEKEGVGCR